jgi:NADH-quinone oxidoreductase subunit E
MAYLSKRLGIKPGETTADGRVTLREVECLGACIGAPMMQIGKQYYENLTTERIDRILDNLE